MFVFQGTDVTSYPEYANRCKCTQLLYDRPIENSEKCKNWHLQVTFTINKKTFGNKLKYDVLDKATGTQLS